MEKFVLITGATGDLGRCICEKLAEDGFSLLLHSTGRNKEAYGLLSNNAKSKVKAVFEADFTCKSEIEQFCDQLVGSLPYLDCVINNAGVGISKQISLFTDLEIEQLLSVNLLAPMILTKKLMPLIEKSALKRVINIGSIGSFKRKELFSVYCASKSGLTAFMECLQLEMQPISNLKISNIYPGKIDTKMLRETFPDVKNVMPPSAIASMISYILEYNPFITDVTMRY